MFLLLVETFVSLMKIVNGTIWRTDQIKQLIIRVAEDELEPGQLKHARIDIKYQRSGTSKLGHCTYGTPRNPRVVMTLLFPRTGVVDLAAYALIIAHELAHAKGGMHREMYKTNRYWWLEGWQARYSYALQFAIEVKVVIKPSREEITLRRRDDAVRHAHVMVVKWTTTAKRAGTQLTKWRTRLKTAERRVMLPPKPPQKVSLPQPELGTESSVLLAVAALA